MNNRKAFTVVEILIVLAIIAILTNFMVLSIRGFQSEARASKVNADLKTLQVALESFLKNNDRYPETENYQNELLMTRPRILEDNLVDPFAPNTTTTYKYALSEDKNYYVLYSVGMKKIGSAIILDDGTLVATNGAIWVSNSSRQ